MSQKAITRNLHLNAELMTVYELISTPEGLTQWYCDVVKKTEAGLDFRWKMQDGQEVGFEVVIADNTAPKRFAYHSTDEDAIVVTFELSSENGATQLSLNETGFSDDEAGQALRSEHEGGWDFFFSRLKQITEQDQ